MKQRVYEILSSAGPGDHASRFVDFLIMGLIIFNVGAVIVETVDEIHTGREALFNLFELVSVAIFTMEYVLRLWSCTVDPRYASPVMGRIRYATRPLMIIDFLAIIPFYLPFFFAVDLRILRVLRLLRIFRLLKLGRYSRALQTLGDVLTGKKEELLISLFVVMMLLVLASSCMYYAEKDAQPEVFSSIPAAMWWGIATLSTVGYGDVVPVTAAGKIIGAVVAMLGIGMFALPAGILGGAFVEEMGARRRGEPGPDDSA